MHLILMIIIMINIMVYLMIYLIIFVFSLFFTIRLIICLIPFIYMIFNRFSYINHPFFLNLLIINPLITIPPIPHQLYYLRSIHNIPTSRKIMPLLTYITLSILYLFFNHKQSLPITIFTILLHNLIISIFINLQ